MLRILSIMLQPLQTGPNVPIRTQLTCTKQARTRQMNELYAMERLRHLHAGCFPLPAHYHRLHIEIAMKGTSPHRDQESALSWPEPRFMFLPSLLPPLPSSISRDSARSRLPICAALPFPSCGLHASASAVSPRAPIHADVEPDQPCYMHIAEFET